MTPKNNVRHSDQAYEALKQSIIQLKLAPGSAIEENSLMVSLGIGRTPLREALQRLSQEDLIKSIPRRGYFVSNINHGDALHVFEVRKHLESFSAILAAKRANETDITKIAAYLDELESESENSDFNWNLEADLKFHQLISGASGNPFLQQTLDRLFSLTIRLLYLNRLPVTIIKEELDSYKAIFAAIQAHDPEAASEAMIKHLGFPLMRTTLSNDAAGWPPTSNN
jgi:GntR family transcriptional regulator, rspAB operon transcriptional repressor